MAARYIENRNKPVAPTDIDDPETARRKQVAAGLKLTRGALRGVSGSSLPQPRQEPYRPSSAPIHQQGQHQAADNDDTQSLFGNTTLGDDSDDTTIGIYPSNQYNAHDEQPRTDELVAEYQEYEVDEVDGDNHGNHGSRDLQAFNHRLRSVIEQPANRNYGQLGNVLSHRGRHTVSQYSEETPGFLEADQYAEADMPNMNTNRIMDMVQNVQQIPGWQNYQKENDPVAAFQLPQMRSIGASQAFAGRFETAKTTTALPKQLQPRAQHPARIAAPAHVPINDKLPRIEDNGLNGTEQYDNNLGDGSSQDNDHYGPDQQLQGQFTTVATSGQQGPFDSESDPESGSREGSPSERLSRAMNGRVTPVQSPLQKKRRATQLDYDENALKSMKYDELKDQPFDNSPGPIPSKTPQVSLPSGRPGPDATLTDRLEYYSSDTTIPSEKQQFLGTLSLEEWETAGDWFLGRFGAIINQLKDARKAKREISKKFEDEIARREEAVRGKTDHYTREMNQMKAVGQKVLKGKSTS